MKAGKVVKNVFLILLLAFFALILIRIFMMEDKRTLKEIYPTDGAKAAYSQLSGDAFTYHNMSKSAPTATSVHTQWCTAKAKRKCSLP